MDLLSPRLSHFVPAHSSTPHELWPTEVITGWSVVGLEVASHFHQSEAIRWGISCISSHLWHRPPEIFAWQRWSPTEGTSHHLSQAPAPHLHSSHVLRTLLFRRSWNFLCFSIFFLLAHQVKKDTNPLWEITTDPWIFPPSTLFQGNASLSFFSLIWELSLAKQIVGAFFFTHPASTSRAPRNASSHLSFHQSIRHPFILAIRVGRPHDLTRTKCRRLWMPIGGRRR